MIKVKKLMYMSDGVKKAIRETFYVKDAKKIKFWRGMAKNNPDTIIIEELK